MEKRTKIIIATVILFVVGLPLFIYIQIAQGFGSSSGDYFKISDLYITLISPTNKPDSANFKFFNKITNVDTTNQIALCLYLSTDYYSSKINYGSTLMAALEPGTKGSKEKIKTISTTILDLKTKKENEINLQMYTPTDIKTFNDNSENSLFKEFKTCIRDEGFEYAILFENFDDFKNKFNSYSADLSHFGIRETPVIFFLDKSSFKNIDSTYKLTLKFLMTDNTTISASTKELKNN